MNPCPIENIEQSILRMTAVVRASQSRNMARSLGENPDAPTLGWWVLACGQVVNDEEFSNREKAREKLRHRVLAAGILLSEYIWVWDESQTTQLVIATLPSEERAKRVAEKLRGKGLKVRVCPETI